MFDHARLAEQIETPVCLDESIRSSEDARKAIEMGACRIINVKLGRVGGHTEARRVEEVCRTRNVPVWCGGMLESGIGRAHNIAMATLAGFTCRRRFGSFATGKRHHRPAVEVTPRGRLSAEGQARVMNQSRPVEVSHRRSESLRRLKHQIGMVN